MAGTTMCDATDTTPGELTPCERCQTPFIFTQHPQLCHPCHQWFHEHGNSLQDITEEVWHEKQLSQGRWVVRHPLVTQIQDVLLLQTGAGFRYYVRSKKG